MTQNGVITHLEPDTLECEVKWALGNITLNKAHGGLGQTIYHYNHLEKILLSYQVTKATGPISKQMPQETCLLCFSETSNLDATKERGGKPVLIVPLEKSHSFPPQGWQ